MLTIGWHYRTNEEESVIARRVMLKGRRAAARVCLKKGLAVAAQRRHKTLGAASDKGARPETEQILTKMTSTLAE